MNRKLIGIALFLLFSNFVYAEEQQANFLVIEGNSRISNEEIVEYSGFQVGKIYNNEDISNIIKNLFSTNLFVDIKVNLDQNTLYISVVETPIISRINIDGNKLVETEQIISSLKSVGISQSKPYSKNLVDKVQQELTRLYYDNGRYSSSIDITENTLDDNLLELDINIDEGTASTIKEVKILGNKSFTARQLKSIIKSGPKYWFEVWSSKDIYNSSLLDQDIFLGSNLVYSEIVEEFHEANLVTIGEVAEVLEEAALLLVVFEERGGGRGGGQPRRPDDDHDQRHQRGRRRRGGQQRGRRDQGRPQAVCGLPRRAEAAAGALSELDGQGRTNQRRGRYRLAPCP